MSQGVPASDERSALRVQLDCQLDAVRPAVVRLLNFLRDRGVDDEGLASCELALVEGCNNAVDHVSPDGAHLPIGVEASCGVDDIEFRIEDHTPGFVWPVLPHLPPDDAEDGRGLFLIHSLMTSVDYLRGKSGNCLVLRLKRRRPAEDSVASVTPSDLPGRLAESERIIRDMADELSSCYESLAAIFRYSGEQSSAVDIEGFIDRLLADLLQVTKSSWYVLRLLQPEPARLLVTASTNTEMLGQAVVLVEENGGDRSLEEQAAQGRRDAWFERIHALSPQDPLAQIDPQAFGLVHPLYLGEDLVGTLAIGGTAGDRRFTAAQTSVVQTFGDFLAIQVVNARFHEERLRNILVAQELEIAKKIQRSLLPARLPQWPGLLLWGSCESASEVGGDFYDVIPLSGNDLLVVVGDAMGKGLPAAMFALILRSLVRALQDQGVQPARLLRRANELLYEELSRMEMFITAQLAYVDVDASAIVVANAGHCPLLHCPGDGQPVAAMSPEGMPLGVLAKADFEEETLKLKPGGRVLMYTDGVTETVRPGGEFFGQTRLAEWLARQTSKRAAGQAMRDSLVSTLADYQGSPVLVDDQTFVILGR